MHHLLGSKAQSEASGLGYVPLKGTILSKAKKAVEQIQPSIINNQIAKDSRLKGELAPLLGVFFIS